MGVIFRGAESPILRTFSRAAMTMSMRGAAVLMLWAPFAAGCGSVREKLLPKADVLGVSVVEVTPEHILVRVDVKTDDVDLMLGMVKVKYKLTLLDTAQAHQNDNLGKR